eukprot:3892424-Pleurochrysis_carterae.AAC.1
MMRLPEAPAPGDYPLHPTVLTTASPSRLRYPPTLPLIHFRSPRRLWYYVSITVLQVHRRGQALSHCGLGNLRPFHPAESTVEGGGHNNAPSVVPPCPYSAPRWPRFFPPIRSHALACHPATRGVQSAG